jgi:hypothetical protein
VITPSRDVVNGDEESDLVIEILIIELKDTMSDRPVAKAKETPRG